MDLVKCYETFLSIRKAAKFEFKHPIEYGRRNLTAVSLKDFAYVNFSVLSMNELINTTNTFGYYIISLRAWQQTLDLLKPSLADQLSLQLEFIEPILACAINSPYALKNQYIYTGVKLLQIACSLSERWIPEDRDINLQFLKKILPASTVSKNFLSALYKIDTPECQNALGNTRNLSHHRIPRNFEFGVVPHVSIRKNIEGRKEIEVGSLKPIPISVCIDLLYEEHANSQELLDIYWSFVREQHENLISKSPI